MCITPHAIAIDRARAAVAEVNARLAAMKSRGELRELNASFKAPRANDPSLPYAEFFDAKRAALLAVLAKQVNSQRRRRTSCSFD